MPGEIPGRNGGGLGPMLQPRLNSDEGSEAPAVDEGHQDGEERRTDKGDAHHDLLQIGGRPAAWPVARDEASVIFLFLLPLFSLLLASVCLPTLFSSIPLLSSISPAFVPNISSNLAGTSILS